MSSVGCYIQTADARSSGEQRYLSITGGGFGNVNTRGFDMVRVSSSEEFIVDTFSGQDALFHDAIVALRGVSTNPVSYVQAMGGGGGGAWAPPMPVPGPWETFQVVKLAGSSGRKLAWGDSFALQCTTSAPQWSSLRVIRYFLTLDNSGRLAANAPRATGLARFRFFPWPRVLRVDLQPVRVNNDSLFFPLVNPRPIANGTVLFFPALPPPPGGTDVTVTIGTQSGRGPVLSVAVDAGPLGGPSNPASVNAPEAATDFRFDVTSNVNPINGCMALTAQASAHPLGAGWAASTNLSFTVSPAFDLVISPAEANNINTVDFDLTCKLRNENLIPANAVSIGLVLPAGVALRPGVNNQAMDMPLYPGMRHPLTRGDFPLTWSLRAPQPTPNTPRKPRTAPTCAPIAAGFKDDKGRFVTFGQQRQLDQVTPGLISYGVF